MNILTLITYISQISHKVNGGVRLPYHNEVPLAQLVGLGRLLLLRVAVQDVILTWARAERGGDVSNNWRRDKCQAIPQQRRGM